MALFVPFASHRFASRTGDTTALAAGAGVFAWRYGGASPVFGRITQMDIGLVVTTGFTAAQLVGFDLVPGRSFSGSPSGGTPGTFSPENTEMRAAAKVEASFMVAIQTATTVALTLNATPDTTPFGIDAVWALAGTAGARIRTHYDFTSSEQGGWVFAINDGPVVRNLVLQGAGGTVQFFIEAQWDEGLLQ
jgi:hypothetical protein